MRDGFTELQTDALCVTQALLGVISQNFRMVSVTREEQRVVVRILLACENGEDIEEIDDLKTELEACFPGSVEIDVKVAVSEEPLILDPPSESTIVVFKRRE